MAMALQDLARRLKRIERAAAPRPLDHKLVAEWVDVIAWLNEIEVRAGRAAPMTEQEILEHAREQAAEGETWGHMWAEILREIWADPPPRPAKSQC